MPAGSACSPGRAAIRVAAVIALAFAALGIHIATGGAYEVRTLAAMTLRTLLWAGIGAPGYAFVDLPQRRREGAA